MFNSKKGAVASEEIVGAVTIFVSLLLVVAMVYYGNWNSSRKTKAITAQLDQVELNDDFFEFLNVKINDRRKIADLISESYEINDYSQLRKAFSSFFETDLGEVGYDLQIDGKSITNTVFYGKTINSVISVPSFNKKPLRVEILVGNAQPPSRSSEVIPPP